jgi:hypothetical protein
VYLHSVPTILRHRRISLEHLRGVPWARIGEAVGQRNLAVTANTYTHVLTDETEIDTEVSVSELEPEIHESNLSQEVLHARAAAGIEFAEKEVYWRPLIEAHLGAYAEVIDALSVTTARSPSVQTSTSVRIRAGRRFGSSEAAASR